MNLLGIVQEFCRRTALAAPLAVMSSQDDQLLQIVGLANEGIEDLLTRGEWTQQQTECTFTSVAGENQGVLETLAPGMKYVINETIFDRTRRLPVFGPRNAHEWQQYKALPFTGPYYKYRFRQGQLLINPPMPVGHDMAFEYVSRYTVLDNTTVVPAPKQYFTADTDTFLLGDNLLLAWLRWAWKKEKGLTYSEDFRSYEVLVATALGHDGTKATLSMNGGNSAEIQPGIFVPAGNWNV